MVTSRYGEATTFSGMSIPACCHCSTSLSVSSGSTATVSASSTEGRDAFAKASARAVGLCSLETSTTARTRLGSIFSSPSTSAVSADTRS